MLSLIFLYPLVAETYVLYKTRKPSLESYNVILLLGCNGNPRSALVLDRVAHALEAQRRWPMAKLVISGNENRGEVSVYKNLIAEAGGTVAAAEGKSLNTWDNMHHVRPFIEGTEHVLIVTSRFHQCRALAMARSLGMKAGVLRKEERRYKKSALYFIKERLSIYLHFPLMLSAKKIY